MTSLSKIAATAAAALVLTAPFAASASAAEVGSTSGSTAAKQLRKGLPSTATPAAAKAKLTKRTVRVDGTMAGYSRDLFPHWRDASTWGWPEKPSNYCDVRGAALYRHGTNVTMTSRCTYIKGVWTDPYTAKRFNAASDIDIDHVVSLAEAYRTGAKSWSKDKKTKFANDPLVVAAAWDKANAAKGDKSPEAWKPANKAAHCNYAIRWIWIKDKYALTMTKTEKAALTTMLGTCA